MPRLNKTGAGHHDVSASDTYGPGGGTLIRLRLPRHDLPRLRTALTVCFALDGFLFSSWVVRIPAVKSHVEASASALGLALLSVSVGAVCTMALTGTLCHRFGTRPMTVASLVLLAVALFLPPIADSVAVLAAVLFVFGIGYGGANVAMNSAAVEVIERSRRPIMPSFHAAFSLGGLLGSGLGGLLAGRLSVGTHLGLAALLGLVVAGLAGALLLGTPMPPRPEREAEEQPAGAGCPNETHVAGRRRMSGRVWLLVVATGVIALCTAYGEGSLADWGALHLRQDLHTSAGTAAVGYAAFSCAMTLGRLSGTTLLERIGPTGTMLGGGLLACAGMLLTALTPVLTLAVFGFVVVGLGLANIFPIAIGQAGTLGGPTGVATTSTLGYGGNLLGPVVIGFLADAAGLPTALVTIAVLAAVAAALAPLVRNRSL